MSKSGRTWVVDQNHKKSSDKNKGTPASPLKTINAAAQLAQPGDTVLIRAGTYGELVSPARGGEEGRPITYAAAPGEIVYVKGSDLYRGKWQATRTRGVFRARLDAKKFGKWNPYTIRWESHYRDYAAKYPNASGHLTLGQVCVDGVMLDEVDNAADLRAMPGTWMAADRGKSLLVHFPQDGIEDVRKRQVEYTVRRAVFRPEPRGLGYITIRGLRMEHAANQAISAFWQDDYAPQAGLVSCRSGHHWIIENCQIRWARGIGIDCGGERSSSRRGQGGEADQTPTLLGYHIFRHNIISDNGEGAICGNGHIGTQILYNVIERNNNLGATAWEEAAIKTHFFIHGRIEGNLIRDNYTCGIWIDNVYEDIRITRNVILNNHGGGIFCEMGGSVLIDNNVIGLSATNTAGGSGIYAHDAGGVTIAHNLLVENASYGVFLTMVTKRDYTVFPKDIKTFAEKPLGKHPCVCWHQRVFNNIFIRNHRAAICLPVEGPDAQDNQCDYNVYATGAMTPIDYHATMAGGTSMERIRELLSEAEEAAGIPIDERSRPSAFDKGVVLSLRQWQMLMKMDQHSVSGSLANSFWQVVHAGQGPWVAYKTDVAPASVGCKPIEGVDKDFFGNPMPEDRVMPGPFQQVNKVGDYRLRLWPIGTGTQHSKPK